MVPSGCRLDLLFGGPREEHLVNKDGFVEAFPEPPPLFSVAASLGKGRDVLLCFASRIPLPLGGEVGRGSLSLCQLFLMLRDSQSLGPWHRRPLQETSVAKRRYKTKVRAHLPLLPSSPPLRCPQVPLERTGSGETG